MDHQTRMLSQILALGTDPDTISFVEESGEPQIVLGTVSLTLSLSSQGALDKLATVTAQAAAARRATSLREVA